MKKLALGSVVGLFLLSAPPVFSQDKMAKDRSPSSKATLQLAQCALKVSGMSCGGCAGAVEQGLLKLDGVRAAKVDLKSGDVRLEYDSKRSTPEKIVAAFNQANSGFRAQLPKSNGK